jgi:hypothetical protein
LVARKAENFAPIRRPAQRLRASSAYTFDALGALLAW